MPCTVAVLLLRARTGTPSTVEVEFDGRTCESTAQAAQHAMGPGGTGRYHRSVGSQRERGGLKRRASGTQLLL